MAKKTKHNKTKPKRILISDAAAAEQFGVSRTTVRRLRYEGKFKTYYVRRAARVDQYELDDYIASLAGLAHKAGAGSR